MPRWCMDVKPNVTWSHPPDCRVGFSEHRLSFTAIGQQESQDKPTLKGIGLEAPPEKPKLKDFGSSLEGMKWDPKKNAVVTKPKKQKQNKKDDDDVIRVQTTLVISDVLVLDSQGRAVQGLTGENFVVTEDGQPQQVGMFSLGDGSKIPRTIALVIDSSLNQSGFVHTSVEAAKTLVDGLGPRDKMAIVTDEVELLVDFTADKKKLKEKLESLKSRPEFRRRRILPGTFDPVAILGRGAHFSALLATLNEAFNDEDSRPIVIFQANGNEASALQDCILDHLPLPPTDLSGAERDEAEEIYLRMKQHEDRIWGMRQFSLSDVYKAAEKSRATIYAVVPGYRLLGLPAEEQIKRTKAWHMKFALGRTFGRDNKRSQAAGFGTIPSWLVGWSAESIIREQGALASLAGRTGGWADFLEEPEQAATIYSRILSDVNQRYLVGFYPTNKEHDGKRRQVKIEVRGHPEYRVVGRKSYYAPGPD